MTPEKVAIAWGWIMTAGGIGGFIAPVAVGVIRDSFGSFIPGFLVFTALAWSLFFVGFLISDTGPRHSAIPELQAQKT